MIVENMSQASLYTGVGGGQGLQKGWEIQKAIEFEIRRLIGVTRQA